MSDQNFVGQEAHEQQAASDSIGQNSYTTPHYKPYAMRCIAVSNNVAQLQLQCV